MCRCFYAFFYAFKEAPPFKCIEKSIGCVATPLFIKGGTEANPLYKKGGCYTFYPFMVLPTKLPLVSRPIKG